MDEKLVQVFLGEKLFFLFFQTQELIMCVDLTT